AALGLSVSAGNEPSVDIVRESPLLDLTLTDTHPLPVPSMVPVHPALANWTSQVSETTVTRAASASLDVLADLFIMPSCLNGLAATGWTRLTRYIFCEVFALHVSRPATHCLVYYSTHLDIAGSPRLNGRRSPRNYRGNTAAGFDARQPR